MFINKFSVYNKKKNTLMLRMFLLSLILFAQVIYADGYTLPGYEFDRPVCVQSVTATSAFIHFRYSLSTNLSIDYGTEESNLNKNAAVALDTEALEPHVYVCKLEALIPSTKYYYRVKADGGYIDTISRSFYTHPLKGDGSRLFSFWPCGDHHFNPLEKIDTGYNSRISVIMDRVAPRPVFCIFLGDQVGQVGSQENYYLIESYWRALYKSAGNIPIWTVVGNHDQDGLMPNNTDYIFEANYMPHNNPEKTEAYYSFYYGNAKVIILMGLNNDTNTAPGRWLYEQIKDTVPMWKIVCDHYPVLNDSAHFTSANQDNVGCGDSILQSWFDEFGVDLFLNGHIHFYERSTPLRWGDKYIDATNRSNSTDTARYTKNRGEAGTIYFTSGTWARFELNFIEIDGNVMRGNMMKQYNYPLRWEERDPWVFTKVISSNESPVADILFPSSDTVIEIGSSVSFKGTAFDYENGELSNFSWTYRVENPNLSGEFIRGETSFGNGSICTYTPDMVGIYIITLTVQDNNDATNSISRKIQVAPVLEQPIKLNFGANSYNPAGWTKVGTNEFIGSAVSYEGGSSQGGTPNGQKEDLTVRSYIYSTSTATWRKRLAPGKYVVSFRCASPVDTRSIDSIKIQGSVVVSNTKSLEGLNNGVMGYSATCPHPLGEAPTNYPRSCGAPAVVEYYPVTIGSDSVLSMELNKAHISEMRIYRVISESATRVEHTKGALDEDIELSCAPNPFNPQTTITINALKGTKAEGTKFARVEIYDIKGKLINFVPLRLCASAPSLYSWNAQKQPSGIYIVKAMVRGSIVTKKITILR